MFTKTYLIKAKLLLENQHSKLQINQKIRQYFHLLIVVCFVYDCNARITFYPCAASTITVYVWKYVTINNLPWVKYKKKIHNQTGYLCSLA